jgi:hypothetical protein
MRASSRRSLFFVGWGAGCRPKRKETWNGRAFWPLTPCPLPVWRGEGVGRFGIRVHSWNLASCSGARERMPKKGALRCTRRYIVARKQRKPCAKRQKEGVRAARADQYFCERGWRGRFPTQGWLPSRAMADRAEQGRTKQNKRVVGPGEPVLQDVAGVGTAGVPCGCERCCGRGEPRSGECAAVVRGAVARTGGQNKAERTRTKRIRVWELSLQAGIIKPELRKN